MQLAITAKSGASYVPFLRRHIRAAHRALKSRVDELSVALVGEAAMSRIHKQFMKIAGPTDVITFELDHNKEGVATSGEIIICVGEARRQARLRGTSARHELLLYAIHGLLHLSGFDDRTAASYAAMHRKEDEILERIGVGALFAPSRKQRGR